MFPRRFVFVLVTLVAVVFAAGPVAAAEEGAGHEESEIGSLAKMGIGIAAGIGLGLAALGGGLGQGRCAAAFLEGSARNPGAADRMFVPMILGFAFIESLVIFTFVICYFLYGKL